MTSVAGDPITYLDAKEAQDIDVELMGPSAFSIDQLMELAGLSVAAAVQKEYAPGRVLVVCGPGNNGGDGLVAARHLKHFGFDVVVVYPKVTKNALYQRLQVQCQELNIPIETAMPDLKDFDVAVDAIFGFSFSGTIRPPFDGIVRQLTESPCPVVSVDVPSGWPVDGPAPADGLRPAMLVSLTAPKLCARDFHGVHYVGGRFVPPEFAKRRHLVLPQYPGAEQCVRIDGSKMVTASG
eukprot:EG_transcript_22384